MSCNNWTCNCDGSCLRHGGCGSGYDYNNHLKPSIFPYTTNFKKVKEFHDTFGLKVNKSATNVDVADKELRIKLIKEEFKEVMEEFEAPELDLQKLGKELADLLYVVYGTGVTYGLNLDNIFEEVQRSNMSKLGEDGTPVRREDGKILKGPNYSDANLNNVKWDVIDD